MFLHLGNDRVISGEKVIAIVNLEGLADETTRIMMERAAGDGRLAKVGPTDKQKALVICDDCLYISPISSHTLYKRSISRQEV